QLKSSSARHVDQHRGSVERLSTHVRRSVPNRHRRSMRVKDDVLPSTRNRIRVQTGPDDESSIEVGRGVLDPVDIHRVLNAGVGLVLYQVSQCAKLIVLVVQNLKGTGRVPT